MPSASKCGRLQQIYVGGLLCSVGSVVSTKQFLFRDDEDL